MEINNSTTAYDILVETCKVLSLTNKEEIECVNNFLNDKVLLGILTTDTNKADDK